MKRPTPPIVSASASSVDGKPPLGLASYPLLWSYLADATWDDGEGRETATLLIFTEIGVLKACLSDRERGLVTFRAGSSLEGLLEALETGLREGTTDWRPGRKGKR